MDQMQILGMLNLLNATYPQYTRHFDKDLKKSQMKVWSMVLANDDPKVVERVIKKHIATSEYFPTPAEIRAGIREITMPSPGELYDVLERQGSRSMQATQELVKRGENGQADTYRTVTKKEEAFNALPPILKEYVNTPDGLQEWHRASVRDSEKTKESFIREIKKMIVSYDTEQMQIGGK